MEIRSLEDLVYALLNEIGLSIGPRGVVYDSDTGIELQYDGKHIVASIDAHNPAIPTDIYAVFDPVFDGRFMVMMLGYYMNKSAANGYFEPLTMFEEIEEVPDYAKTDPIRSKRTREVVAVRVNEGYTRKYYSKFYYQKGLKCSQAILNLGGYENVDLSMFDSLPDEVINSIAIITNNYSTKGGY